MGMFDTFLMDKHAMIAYSSMDFPEGLILNAFIFQNRSIRHDSHGVKDMLDGPTCSSKTMEPLWIGQFCSYFTPSIQNVYVYYFLFAFFSSSLMTKIILLYYTPSKPSNKMENGVMQIISSSHHFWHSDVFYIHIIKFPNMSHKLATWSQWTGCQRNRLNVHKRISIF